MEKYMKFKETKQRQNPNSGKSFTQLQQECEDSEHLQALLDDRTALDDDMDDEKQSQRDLKKEILDVEMKLHGLRENEGDLGMETIEVQQAVTAIAKLEDKLGRASAHLSEQLNKNRILREELQSCYNARVRFQHVHRRLNKEMQDISTRIRDMVNHSSHASDTRLDAMSKMSHMSKETMKDFAVYNAEKKELERMLSHEQGLKNFKSIKCFKRCRKDEEALAHKQLLEMKEQQRMEADKESLDALERMKQVTGVDNLDTFVDMYIEGEDTNLSLFKVVNEQNNKAEALREDIKQFQAEMEKVRERDLQQERERSALLRDSNEKLRECESQTNSYTTKADAMNAIMEKSTAGIRNIFAKLDCDRSAIEAMLGADIMSYLVMIEQKTNELLTLQALHVPEDLDDF